MESRETHFDVIIIGSGTSAYYTASGLLAAKKRVAMIDELPFGGTCALRGCQPKKYLVANAEIVAAAKHLVGKGIKAAPQTSWTDLQSLKNEFLDGKPEKSLENWQKRGVTTFLERARLSGPKEVTLGSGMKLTADYIVLATGSTPRELDIPGSHHAKISDDFLELSELPERICFIGGGYISFEFAHVAANAGAKVTVIHRSEKPLSGFDPDMVDTVVKASRAAGIDIVLSESPTRIEAQDNGYKINTDAGRVVETDYIVSAIGRVANLSVLEGNAGNGDCGPNGVAVNEFLQSTSNPSIYAVGDCADRGKMLATVADDQGKIAARNILEGNSVKADHRVVPSAVFTIPNLASVGLTEQQASEQGLDFRINKGSTAGWPSSKRIGETQGTYKVLIDNKTGLLLGAHLARHNAADVINVFGLAIAHDIPAKQLAEFLWAYPTYVSDIKYMVG
jgi:glutathione reductase (NADPH)